MTATTTAGAEALDAIRADPRGCLAAFDYDGTLAPIVPDPTAAIPHRQAVAALTALAGTIGTVAVITGRPARTAVELGGFEQAGGLDGLVVVGHYGLERWDAGTGTFQAADPPAGLDVVRAAIPGLLVELGLSASVIEDKGLSVAVHVRRMAEPQRAFDTMKQPLIELARRNGLAAEPGRLVVELRPQGIDKGQALRSLVEEKHASSVVFTGDDLGDLAAFDEVVRLRSVGVPGLLVCSGSDEVSELADRADVVVDGPAGVVAFVNGLTAELG